MQTLILGERKAPEKTFYFLRRYIGCHFRNGLRDSH